MYRTRHKTKSNKSVYAIRNKNGSFKDIQNIERSINRDSKTSAKKVTKKVQGFKGDYATGVFGKQFKVKLGF